MMHLAKLQRAEKNLTPCQLAPYYAVKQGEKPAEPVARQNWTGFWVHRMLQAGPRNPIEEDFHGMEPPCLLSQCGWQDL